MPLGTLASGLRAVPDALDILDTTDPATGVRQMFSWSYRLLSDDAADLFRNLVLHPGPDVAVTTAASVVGWPERRTRAALDELVEAHLIDEQRPGRFGFHDLLRAYAREMSEALDAPTARAAAVGRMLDYYVHSGHAAAMALEPLRPRLTLDPAGPGVTVDGPADHAAAQAWFVAERAALLGLVDLAVREGHDTHCWQLAWAMIDFLNRSGRSQDCARSLETALAAATRLDDRHALARIHRALGFALVRLGQIDDAVRHSRRAVAFHRALSDHIGRAHAHLNLGGIAMMRAGRATTDAERLSGHLTALRHTGRAADLFGLAGDRVFEAQALANMGWVYSQVGEHRRAVAVCERSIALLDDVGAPRHAQADALDTLGHAHYHLGEHAEAEARYRQALARFADRGNRRGEAETLTHLGEDRLGAGDEAGARAAWHLALEIVLEVDPASVEPLKVRLASLAEPSLPA